MGSIHIVKYCCLITKSGLTLFYPWTVAWLQWVAVSFSRGSSPPRYQTHLLYCRWIPYHRATREVLTEYHSSIKRKKAKKALIQAIRWMNPENVTLSERSQTWKTTCSMILVTWNVQNRQIYKDKWRSVVTGGWEVWGIWGVTVNRYGVSFENDVNNIKLTVVMDAQFCEYIKYLNCTV